MGVKILGVSCFFHDSAACLLDDGVIVAAAQNERFSRIKHDPRFPLSAINYCLEEARCNASDIDFIAFYERPRLALDRIASTLLTTAVHDAARVLMEIAPQWRDHKYDPRKTFRAALPDFRGDILFLDHHQSHAGSAFSLRHSKRQRF